MFFKRKDGTKDRNVDIFERIMPIIMKERNDALVYMKKELPLDGMNKYILEQKSKGIEITHMEIIFASLVRVLKEKPKINRFVMGGELYNRNNIEISVTVKPRFEENVKESVAKIRFSGNENIFEVSEKLKEEVKKIKEDTEKNNKTDDFADKFKNIPTILLKIGVKSLMILDNLNILPKKIIEASPFHSSIFVTNVGSIGLEAIYHHIYNFGTVGIFVSIGKKKERTKVLIEKIDGKQIQRIIKEKYLELGIVSDERICDGHYFSVCMKKIMRYLKNPELLEKMEYIDRENNIEKNIGSNAEKGIIKNKINTNVKKVLKKSKKIEKEK